MLVGALTLHSKVSALEKEGAQHHRGPGSTGPGKGWRVGLGQWTCRRLRACARTHTHSEVESLSCRNKLFRGQGGAPSSAGLG